MLVCDQSALIVSNELFDDEHSVHAGGPLGAKPKIVKSTFPETRNLNEGNFLLKVMCSRKHVELHNEELKRHEIAIPFIKHPDNPGSLAVLFVSRPVEEGEFGKER